VQGLGGARKAELSGHLSENPELPEGDVPHSGKCEVKAKKN